MDRTAAKYLLVLSALGLMACARSNDWPSLDESGDETASVVEPIPEATPVTNPTNPPPSTAPAPTKTRHLLLNQAMTLRYEKAGVLESKVELPEGTQIEVPLAYEVKHIDFRNSNGGIERSSTGFIYPVKIVSMAPQYKSVFPQSMIEEINRTNGGLFIMASIVGNLEGLEGQFAVVSAAPPGAGFLKYYNPSGKPKFKYTNSVSKRFGPRLNKGIDPGSLSTSEKTKWQRIHNELKKAVNRTMETPRSYLMMDKAKATQASIDFEKKGIVSTGGAWTIATQGTAVRHGFPNVPCAEFQSELLRQAYQRAGYRVTEDFNSSKGNPLIWSNSAAVVNFSMALYKAGWVPWDSTLYRPILGSFLMNGSGLTPGHTYTSGGDDGRLIVDNGAPQGRDLRKTAEKTISIMYQTGVFFLPPGIQPPTW